MTQSKMAVLTYRIGRHFLIIKQDGFVLFGVHQTVEMRHVFRVVYNIVDDVLRLQSKIYRDHVADLPVGHLKFLEPVLPLFFELLLKDDW